MSRPALALTTSACLLALTASPARAAPALDTARIDAVFAAYTDKTPGCALGLMQSGKLVHAKGYGLADLSHGVPIRPDTVFDIGSVSKQFTALALLLLEHDGKLKLSDTLQQHLPELAKDFPQRITIRQLLEHTAGLRDYNELLMLAGQAEENVTGDAEALKVIRAVPALNFAPGTRWSYSNTGYFLAAQIAERVSGQTLDALLQARVFKPLGMAATHVRTDHTQVVAARATAYRPGAEKDHFAIQMSNWNQAGDGAVQSTVQDMARWDAELAAPKLLPPALVQALRTPGRLSDGTPIVYALGQAANHYRGQLRISHGGAWAGYRAYYAQFPAQQAGVVVACNRADANTDVLAARAIDVLLADAFTEPAPLPQPPAPLDAGFDAQRFVGQYLHVDGHLAMSLGLDPKGVMRMHIGMGNSPLRAAGTALQNGSGTLSLQFSADGRELLMLRRADPGRPERFVRLPAFRADAQVLPALAGRYRQAALGGSLQLSLQDGTLMLQAGVDPEAAPLTPIGPDLFSGPGLVLRVERDAQGGVKAVVSTNERVRGLRYVRE